MGRLSSSDISLDPVDRGDRGDRRDNPPLYDNVIEPPSSPQVDYTIPGCFSESKKCHGGQGIATLCSSLSKDPRALYRLVSEKIKLPPRQYVHVNNGTGINADFHFMLDLTSTLVRPPNENSEWYQLHVVTDGDEQEAYRGGPLPTSKRNNFGTRAIPPHLRDLDGNLDCEDQSLLGAEGESSNENTPGLMGWCERFCNDPSPVKSFTFTRKIEGIDFKAIEHELIMYAPSINYRGRMEIKCHSYDNFVTVYSPHWINRLRTSTFVRAIFFITQLWIISWIVIHLLESKYKVVNSVWKSSREIKDITAPSGSRKVYANGRDEGKIADYWAPALIHAGNEGRCQTLTEGDIDRIQRRPRERMENLRSFQSGHNRASDSTAGGSRTDRVGSVTKDGASNV